MADFSQMSDEQLAGCVSSAESGEAVAEMVSRYTGLVLALAGKYSGGADYEELVSDGLDALLSALRKYSPEKGSFSGFASVCVSNRMKNAVDRAKRRNERLEELADEDIPDSSPTPEELVIGRESADEITRRVLFRCCLRWSLGVSRELSSECRIQRSRRSCPFRRSPWIMP